MSASLLIQKVQPELDDLARKYEYVHNIFEKMAGGELVQFNNSLFLSEKSSKDRDCSLAYFMRENKCFPPGAEIKKILDFYSQVILSLFLQVNLFQKHLFLYQLTHNMTKDCSLNYEFST